jgi:nicotinate-nucleotide adenylyltransferase
MTERIKVRYRFIWLLFLGFISFSALALADPISIDAIKNAKRIGFMLGTFDPVTTGHLLVATEAHDQGGLDLVLMLPLPNIFRKTPLSYAIRSDLLARATENMSTVLTPSDDELSKAFKQDGPAKLAAMIRKLNPQAKIYVVAGEDHASDLLSSTNARLKIKPDGWVVSSRPGYPNKVSPVVRGKIVQIKMNDDISSTDVRRALAAHPEVYFSADAPIPEELTKSVVPAVLQRIRTQGLYLGRNPKNKLDLERLFVRYVSVPYLPNWLKELFRKIKIRKFANRNRTQVTMNDKTYSVEHYLGSGFNGDAYKITVDGKQYVAKVPNSASESVDMARSEQLVRRWLELHTDIHVPKLLGFDPQTGVSVAEFIDGADVGTYLNTGQELNENLLTQFKDLYDQSKVLFENTNMRLDIRSDNLKVHDGKVYLVDLGPIPLQDTFPETFQTALKDWKDQATGLKWNFPQCMMNQFRRLLLGTNE